MISLLAGLTIFVNVVGLAISLGLGLYLVTRAGRSLLAWLAALTLWALSDFYLKNVLLIQIPGIGVLPWLRAAPLVAQALGFHLLLLLPPKQELHGRDFFLPPILLPRLRSNTPLQIRIGVPLAYGLAFLMLVLGAFSPGLPPPVTSRPHVFLSDSTVSPIYPVALGYLLLFTVLSLLNLWQRRKQEPLPTRKSQYGPLFKAAIIAGLSGLYLLLGVQLQLMIPAFPGDLGLGSAAVILGYTVIQHYTEKEGVTLNRDLLYVGLGIGSLTILYLVIAKVLQQGGHIFSNLTLIMIIIVAISSLMLYDALRNALDRLFYREHFRRLRTELRALSRETGTHYRLPERLEAVLSALCNTLHVERGLIALRDQELFVSQATKGASHLGEVFPYEALAVTEITPILQPAVDGLQDMALLVPISNNGEQVAALALGGTDSTSPFSEDDLILLDDLADRLAEMIHTTRLQEENTRLLGQMVSDFRSQEHALQRQADSLVSVSLEESQSPLANQANEEFVSSVEDALRRLYDYSYLGEHPLAQLLVVQKRLEGELPESVTHIDCGKALSQFLVQAIQKLRPEGPEPKPLTVPHREWHQFLILHSAYVSGEQTRDIMSRLYIGEGTFNRTRRRALKGLAKAVQEMEQGANRMAQ
jgi:hypothetical protein